MKKILSSILIYTVTITNVMAGLPPASSKASGESVYSTTFKTNYDTIPVTRNGTEITIGTIPTSKGGTGSTNLGTGVLRADSGVMSTASVSLITDISGILPITNGGTGSAIASFDGQYITNVQATNITSTHVIGTPDDITSLERVIDHMWSAGVTDGALLTNNGDGTVNIGSSTTMFRPTKATTITRSGATATATSTAHGLHVGDDVYVSGADQSEYNGSFVVLTAPTADTFTYAVQGTPATPATGTIISGGAHSPIYTANVPAQAGISLTDNATNYLYADYNGGTPQYGVTTSLLNTNCIDKCIAYTIGREGTTLYIIDARGMNVDANRKERRRLLETQGFQHVKGGAAIGATGTRNISVTAGAFYYSFNRIINPAFDTSASDTFKYYYQSSPGVWTFTAASTQIDNLQYDTGTGLGTLSNNKFGVHWVYLLLDSPTTLVVQYGQGDYSTLADAQAASVPTAPPAMQAVGVLIGRVIIQKSAASFSEITSAFTTGFTPSTATSHNGLSGLQGGTASEYYHLTSSEYTGTGTGTIVRASSPTLITPALGTPSALVGTNITGTAAGLTAGTVTTNANLTGDVTSTGNATTYNNVVPTTKGGTGLSTVGIAGQVLTISGASVPAWETPTPRNSPLAMENISFTNTATSNTLVISLKDSAGSDPSSPTSVIGFRSSTITSGLYTDVAVTSATSITISSGSTLGHTSAVSGVIYLYAINNSGTVELAVSGDKLNETYLYTTTAEGGAGGADSSTVLYSTTARTDVPIRLLGRLLSTQTTAGTWATAATSVSANAGSSGTPKVPGLDGNVDTFSVSYGTTNATTVCSASPCSYLDQIGTAVTSVTRSATGTYALNTAKTYSKVKCQLMSKGSAYQSGDPIRCEDCNSVDIVTVQVGVSPQDSYGTISCIGSY